MTKRIFISYRRKSSAFALLMANKLSEHLEASIFIDFESIDQADFERAILTHLRQSDVFLLMVTEHTFSERIHRADDWVRREIQEGLKKEIPFVLVCENGLFPPSDLPDEIRGVAKKQGIEFYPAYFDPAVERLVKFLGNFGVSRKTTPSTPASLPVPEATIASVSADLVPQTPITSVNAQQVLGEALHAYDQDDFAQALFLFETLQSIGYRSKAVPIEALVKEIGQKQAQVERKREAQVDYDELAMFAKFKATLKHAIDGFKAWAKQYPDLVEELDTLRLRDKGVISDPPPPPAKPIQVVTPPPSNLFVPPSPPRDPLAEKLALARTFTGTRNTDWKPIIAPLGELVAGTPMPNMEMCLVPVGAFKMGGENYSDEKPIHPQSITTPYWIARYTVTNAQWREGVRAGAVKEPSDTTWYKDSKMADCPVVYVNWHQALAFAQWARCTLPSELETEYAGRGVESWAYPWGNDYDAKRVVDRDDPTYGGKHPAPVTYKPEGTSWVGAMQLSGNVWQWQRSLYKNYPYQAGDGREDVTNNVIGERILRGGSWSNNDTDRFRCDYRDWLIPYFWYDLRGFRLALS